MIGDRCDREHRLFSFILGVIQETEISHYYGFGYLALVLSATVFVGCYRVCLSNQSQEIFETVARQRFQKFLAVNFD